MSSSRDSRRRSRSRSPVNSSRPSSSRTSRDDRRSSREHHQSRDRERGNRRSELDEREDRRSSRSYSNDRRPREYSNDRKSSRDYSNERGRSSRDYSSDRKYSRDYRVDQSGIKSEGLMSLGQYESDFSQESQEEDFEDISEAEEELDPMEEMFGEELEFLEGGKKERKSRSMGFSCDVCKCTVNNVKALQDHFAGAKHKKALAKRGLSQKLDHLVKLPKDQEVWEYLMRCTLCNVIVQGTEINVHSESPNHQEMLAKVLHNNPASTAAETRWYEVVNTASMNSEHYDISENRYECKLCSVVLPKKDQFESHIQGKKHQKRLRWKLISECEPDEGGNEMAQFWCSVCSIFCSTSEGLDKHFSGKQHGKMLRAKGVSEDEILQGLEENLPVNHAIKPELKDEPSFKEESPESKPKKGLYGSLPQVLEAQRNQSGSQSVCTDSKSLVNTQKPVTPPSQPNSSSSRPGPSAPRAHPLSVGAFLQSLLGDNNTATPSEVEPKAGPVVKDEPVSQYLDRVSYQHRFSETNRSSGSRQESVIEQLASRQQSNHLQHPAPIIQYTRPKHSERHNRTY